MIEEQKKSGRNVCSLVVNGRSFHSGYIILVTNFDLEIGQQLTNLFFVRTSFERFNWKFHFELSLKYSTKKGKV